MIKQCPKCQKPAKIKCECGCHQDDGIWYDTEDLPLCPSCGEVMQVVSDNVGFTAPDSEKIVLSYECKGCRISI